MGFENQFKNSIIKAFGHSHSARITIPVELLSSSQGFFYQIAICNGNKNKFCNSTY